MDSSYLSVRDKVVLAVDLNQKSDFEYTTDGGLKLWGNKDFGHDEKVTRPTIATVVSSRDPDFLAGEMVLCHHHTFSRWVREGCLLGDMGVKDGKGRSLFSIEKALIHMKVDATGEAIPLKGFLTVLRIEVESAGLIIYPDSARKTYGNQFRVLAVGPECEGVSEGDIVVTYEKSDYSMEYAYNGRLKTAIRVKYSDVLATSRDVLV